MSFLFWVKCPQRDLKKIFVLTGCVVYYMLQAEELLSSYLVATGISKGASTVSQEAFCSRQSGLLALLQQSTTHQPSYYYSDLQRQSLVQMTWNATDLKKTCEREFRILNEDRRWQTMMGSMESLVVPSEAVIMDSKMLPDLKEVLVGHFIPCLMLCVICALFVFQRQVKKRRRLRWPRGPRSYPILGSAVWLDGHDVPFAGFTELQKIYGDIFSFQLGSMSCVVINSVKLIHEAFVEKGVDVDERPDFKRFKMLFNGDKDNGKVTKSPFFS